jgi:Tfp pilus assembly PilM family ATPase
VMKSIFFDLRGGGLRALAVENEQVRYKAVFEKFSINDSALMSNVLAKVAGESGVAGGAVNVIVSDEAVILKKFVLPRMPLPDAEKVIRKKIIKEMGIELPIFKIKPIIPGGTERQQTYLAEIIKPEMMKNLIDRFRACNMKVRSVTTGFNANLKALQKSDPDPGQTYAVFDIENDSVSVTVLSGGGIIYYDVTSLPVIDVEREIQNGLTVDRILKRKVYGIIDVIYNFKVSFLEKHPEYAVDKVLLCGEGANLEGIGDSLRDATAKDVSLLNPAADKDEDAPLFVSLHGFAASVADKSVTNFVSAEYGKKTYFNKDKMMIAAAAVYAVAVLMFAVFTEIKYRSAGNSRDAMKKEVEQTAARIQSMSGYVKNIEAVFRLTENQFVFYPLFRYLADNVPADIFIDEIAFRQEKDSEVCTLTFASGATSDVGRKKILTNLSNAMDGFKALKKTGEPAIAIVKEGEKKIMKIKLSYKVNASDKI